MNADPETGDTDSAKRLALAGGVALSALWAPAHATEPARIGVLLGFAGPIDSLAPAIVRAADLAFEEAAIVFKGRERRRAGRPRRGGGLLPP